MPTALIPTEMEASPIVLDTTFREAMTILRVSRSTLYRIMKKCPITYRKVGATWRFSRRELTSESVFRNAPVPKIA